uniref:VWFA domain-containing protein n=1 Tax=Parastrongyloides trichosuri TaxID=131310 RepID=A0A0N5A6B4_PARTI
MNHILKSILIFTISGHLCLTINIIDKKENNCQNPLCNINIILDTSSNVLSNNLFLKTISFIKENISNQIPNYSQLSFTTFDKNIEFSTYGTFNDQTHFVNYLNTVKQSEGFNLFDTLSGIYNLTIPITGKQSTFIFISQYDNLEFKKSIEVSSELRKKGSLNFIIMGTNIRTFQLLQLNPSSIYLFTYDQNDISQLSHFFDNSLTCSCNN